MATIDTIPLLVLPGKQAQFVFTPTSGGNFAKVWCTSAPRGSKLRDALDQQQTARVNIISESDITKRPAYTFDVGGAYVLEIEEFQKGAEAYGGSYSGDPDGHRTEDRVATTLSTIYIASLIETTIGVAPDTATIQLYIHDERVEETSKATHGVATPAIVRPATDRARAAADAVTDELAALGDALASAAVGYLPAVVNNFIDAFNLHIASTTFHANADSNNHISRAFRAPTNLKSTMRSLAECLRRYDQHVRNVDPDPPTGTPESGSADYHKISGNNVVDWENVALAAGGSDIGACVILISDLCRVYSAHRGSAAHLAPDNDNPLDTVAPLYVLHGAFLAELAALSPTTPDNEHRAMTLLVSGAGFRRSAV